MCVIISFYFLHFRNSFFSISWKFLNWFWDINEDFGDKVPVRFWSILDIALWKKILAINFSVISSLFVTIWLEHKKKLDIFLFQRKILVHGYVVMKIMNELTFLAWFSKSYCQRKPGYHSLSISGGWGARGYHQNPFLDLRWPKRQFLAMSDIYFFSQTLNSFTLFGTD